MIKIKPAGIMPQNKKLRLYNNLDFGVFEVIQNVFKADSKPCFR